MGLASEAVDILNVDHINLVVDVEALDVLPVPLDHVDELIAAVESRERERRTRECERGRKEGRKEAAAAKKREETERRRRRRRRDW